MHLKLELAQRVKNRDHSPRNHDGRVSLLRIARAVIGPGGLVGATVCWALAVRDLTGLCDCRGHCGTTGLESVLTCERAFPHGGRLHARGRQSLVQTGQTESAATRPSNYSRCLSQGEGEAAWGTARLPHHKRLSDSAEATRGRVRRIH